MAVNNSVRKLVYILICLPWVPIVFQTSVFPFGHYPLFSDTWENSSGQIRDPETVSFYLVFWHNPLSGEERVVSTGRCIAPLRRRKLNTAIRQLVNTRKFEEKRKELLESLVAALARFPECRGEPGWKLRIYRADWNIRAVEFDPRRPDKKYLLGER